MPTLAPAYSPLPETAAMPKAVERYLDGTDLLAKTQALRLSTIDADGWPHAALLSAGDMLALPSGRIRFALFPQSATTANLLRDGRFTLTVAFDSGMWELKLVARALSPSSPQVPLALFEAELDAARLHTAAFADVSGGISFALHEPDAVLPRWQRQIATLRVAN
jgi:hypothetical protein